MKARVKTLEALLTDPENIQGGGHLLRGSCCFVIDDMLDENLITIEPNQDADDYDYYCSEKNKWYVKEWFDEIIED